MKRRSILLGNLPRTPAKKQAACRHQKPMARYRQLAVVIAGVCATWASAYAADGFGFQSLGLLNGGSYSEAYGISADGSVVVGGAMDGTTNARAFRWTATGGMQSLGLMTGGTFSEARAISGDGNVIVGRGNSATDVEAAFRWTAGGGMQNLGMLNGGTSSFARSVNADGSVVVGSAADGAAGNADRAFRWTQAGGMQSLGVLVGGDDSYAFGVSSDGDVIVGRSSTSGFDHAFRWTSAEGMQDLGTLAGGKQSTARAVSADGSTIVGDSNVASGGSHAFRWIAAGGMQDLGTLGGTQSNSAAVNADGRVVVGSADDAGGDTHPFRWSQMAGMQSLGDWLRASGVTLASSIDSQEGEATGVSADGSVVVGYLDNEAFIARGSSGLMTLSDLAQSLGSTMTVPTVALEASDMVLHGAHGHPLSRRVSEGQNCAWAAGDLGRDDHGRRDGSVGLAEIGGCHVLGPVQASLAVGRTHSDHDTRLGGNAGVDGTYLLAEVIGNPLGNLWATVSGYYHWGDADIRRGYVNAGLSDTSRGDADTRTWGLRARVDWESALILGKLKLTPYAEFSHVRTRVEGYTETGGGFPVRFDARRERSNEFRAGVQGTHQAGTRTRLLGSIEGVHRFEGRGANVSGQVIGLFGFDLEGEDYKQNWLHASAGVEHRVGPGTASLHLNATTRGQDPNLWLAASYQVNF